MTLALPIETPIGTESRSAGITLARLPRPVRAAPRRPHCPHTRHPGLGRARTRRARGAGRRRRQQLFRAARQCTAVSHRLAVPGPAAVAYLHAARPSLRPGQDAAASVAGHFQSLPAALKPVFVRLFQIALIAPCALLQPRGSTRFPPTQPLMHANRATTNNNTSRSTRTRRHNRRLASNPLACSLARTSFERQVPHRTPFDVCVESQPRGEGHRADVRRL